MAKTWILDTETKGTGAHMVPLEKVLRKGGPEPELNLIELNRVVESEPEQEQAPQPLRFKVIDIMTRETLAEDADTRETVEVLGRARSIVDVQVYVWNADQESWRMLTLDERRALWEFRAADAA